MTNDSQTAIQPPASSSIVSIVCRICYDGDKEEALITPCDCKGTIGFVHQTCLENWLAESNSATCELCHYVFDVERNPKYNSTKSVWYWCRHGDGTTVLVRNDILACMLITPLTIIITYICLLSSQYYSQIKFNSEPSTRWTSFSLLCLVGIMFIGYYTWVYAVIRVHGRHWYYWWQRSCTVTLRLPPERSQKISAISVKVINERVPENLPERLPEGHNTVQINVETEQSTAIEIETLPEGDSTVQICEVPSSTEQDTNEITGTGTRDTIA